MNNDVKISLTINVAGSTRHCLGVKKFPYVLRKEDFTSKKLPSKIGKQVVKKGTYTAPIYEYQDAQVHINMCRTAYNYMTSDEKPEWYFKKDWRRLKPDQRLALHMEYIAKSYNGKSFSYNVLED